MIKIAQQNIFDFFGEKLKILFWGIALRAEYHNKTIALIGDFTTDLVVIRDYWGLELAFLNDAAF